MLAIMFVKPFTHISTQTFSSDTHRQKQHPEDNWANQISGLEGQYNFELLGHEQNGRQTCASLFLFFV